MQIECVYQRENEQEDEKSKTKKNTNNKLIFNFFLIVSVLNRI